MVWLDSGALNERVATIEKLADVAAKVLLEYKLSTWVQPFVTIQVQNEIVEDEQRYSSSHSLVNLLRSENHHFILANLCIGSWCRDNHISFAVSTAIETLTKNDHEAERE